MSELPTVSTASDIKGEAQLERERLAKQESTAREQAEAEAARVRAETEQQAEAARGEIRGQAEAAKAEVSAEATQRQAEVRGMQSEAERQAEALKATAREAVRATERSRELPVNRPAALDISDYINEVESARRAAHGSGRALRQKVKELRDKLFSDIDASEAEAIADVDKQLGGIQADIAKSLIETQAEITKEVAKLSSGIKEWETQALKEFRQFQAENIKLDTGEWVSRDVYNKLSPEHRSLLKELGVAKFNISVTKQFQTDNIRLDTGEWVSRDVYDSIPAEYQPLLKELGVTQFNKRIGKEIADFEAKHIEVNPNVWVLKTDWNALTTSQQQEFKDTGQYTVTPTIDITDGQTMFKYLQDAGDIHPLAEYKGYDKDTGEVSYLAPKTELPMDNIMKHWEELNDAQKQIQINGALNKNVRVKYKDFEDLTEDEQRQVLRYYTQSYLPYQTNDIEFFKNLWQEQKTQLKEIGLGMIPVYGTIRNWNKMSNTWRGISIAMDVAVIIPLVRAGINAIRGFATPIRAQVGALTKAEMSITKNMAQTLSRAYAKLSKIPGIRINSRTLSRSYISMIKAQARFTKQLARVADITAKGGKVSNRLKAAVARAELNLRTKATTFVDNLFKANSHIKGVSEIPVRFDSAEIRALMRGLPNELVQNSKAAIRALETRPGNIKALTKAVATAESRLKAAQARYPTDPSKWVDLMVDLVNAEGKLVQARTGSLPNIYSELLAARSRGDTVKAAQLESDLVRALRSMDAEWGRLGNYSGGSVAVGTRTKPWLPKTGVPRVGAPTKTLTGTMAGITAIVTKAGLATWDVTKGTSTPEVIEAAKEIAKSIPKVKGITTPEVVAVTEAALQAALRAALEGKPTSEIEIRAMDATKPIISTYIEERVLPETEAKAMAKAVVKVVTKVATATAKIKAIPKKTKKQPESAKKERPKYPAGTIVWRMGTLHKPQYKVIPPPYNLRKVITETRPPKGMTKTTGTPEQTLTFIKGKLPFKNVAFDLGIVDGYIDVKNKRIVFKGHGLETDVGKRIQSRTKGVSLLQSRMITPTRHKTKARGRKTASRTINPTISVAR